MTSWSNPSLPELWQGIEIKLATFPNPNFQKALFAITGKIKILALLHSKLWIMPGKQMGVGYILLKTGTWSGENYVKKCAMVVATINVPAKNFFQG